MKGTDVGILYCGNHGIDLPVRLGRRAAAIADVRASGFFGYAQSFELSGHIAYNTAFTDQGAWTEMLIITRRPGETFVIGEGADRIEVRILGVIGGQVRFGIEAPRHIVVDRAEVAERKKRARDHAGGAGVGGAADSPLSGTPDAGTIES